MWQGSKQRTRCRPIQRKGNLMALQHHFVVVIEDGKVWIDDDTLNAMFWDGSVYDTDTDLWEANYDHARENETARELLWDKLNKEEA